MTGIPAPSPKNVRPLDLGGLAVEHRGGIPAGGCLAQRVRRLVVARHENGGRLDRRERVDRLGEALVDRGEVTGADDDVDVRAALDERCGAAEVAVEV